MIETARISVFLRHAMFGVALFLMAAADAYALDFGSGSLPIAFEPSKPVALESGSRISISGTVQGNAPATVVLRIDDGQSKDYATRMNDERVLPPGPFALSFDVSSLRATNGRVLNAADIRRVILFVNGAGAASVTQFATTSGQATTPAAAVTGNRSFGSGPLPVVFEAEAPVALDPSGRIDIAGTIDGTAAATVVLRIDDGASTDYASRMNAERNFGPGPFAASFDVAALVASNGRKLNTNDIRRVILFIIGPGSGQAWHFAMAPGVNAATAPAAVPMTTPQAAKPADSAKAIDIGIGALPIAFEPGAPVALPAGGRLEISGVIDGAAPVALVLRVDDLRSTNYNTRMNDERTLPPGPFDLSFDVAALRATDGRQLDANNITRMILFLNGAGSGRVTRFSVVPTGQTRGATLPTVVPTSIAAASPRPAAITRSLGSGALPLKFEPGAPTAFADDDEIIVEGMVQGTAPAAIALRVDDAESNTYPSRYNDERKIPPGPFRFAVGVKGLKTHSGRTLDPARIQRIILFAWEGNPKVTITRFEVSRGLAMPPGAHGYSFGAADAALLAGFERIGPADSRITGRGPVQVIRRPAPDPLIANGLKGVRRIVLPAPGPRVRVTVWSEDPGEWELLPHPFERRIQVNGLDLVNEKLTAEGWIAQRYLRGGRIEHSAQDDAWSAYGARRGNMAAIDVDASREGVAIELSGGDLSAYFINAVLVEAIEPNTDPSKATAGQAFVIEKRAQWYRDKLPVAPLPPADTGAIVVPLSFIGAAEQAPITLKARAAPDTGIGIPFVVTSDAAVERPRITITPPKRGGAVLGMRLWAAQYRLERDDSVLRLRDDRLLADTAALAISKNAPRSYELWVDVPKGTAAGVYTGSLSINAGTQSRTVPIEINVLGVTLPPVAKPAGFYLARAAHLGFFPGLTIERERQAACDLDLLKGFGLTNTAPPIGGLERNDLGVFAADMRRAQKAGVANGWLIYNPLNELTAAQGLPRAADTVGRLEELVKAQDLPQPLWSVADEPSNADQAAGQLTEWVRLLRGRSPGIRLGGHLNAPTDERFAELFDTLIINPGFGIDAGKLNRLKAMGKGVWLYNTSAPRQTAGLWLWRTAAERYVQWHARMPTADPFDPLDGREGDFQMIFPTLEVCPRQPDIHRDLLRMAEGVVDQRWLSWLDGQVKPEARRLREALLATLPDSFSDARSQSRMQLEATRGKIMDLAAQ